MTHEYGIEQFNYFIPRAGKTQEMIPKIFKCIFFTLNTYQETFIGDILWYNLKLYSVQGQTDVKSEIVI